MNRASPQMRNLAKHLMVAEALGFALRYGAELLAIGAVAHSRLRKMPFGGVTRSLIEPPRLPLLLAR